jgi:signal transduction histidine kinase
MIAKLAENNELRVTLVDDGKGFDIMNFNKGHGIDNLKVRAKRIGGTLEIASGEGKGTAIKLIFPLPLKEVKK